MLLLLLRRGKIPVLLYQVSIHPRARPLTDNVPIAATLHSDS
jgi:hypothetical protein